MRQNPRQTILEVIEEFHPQDLSIGELTKNTGMSRDTVSRHLAHLEEKDLVKINRTVGRAKMYTFGNRAERLLDDKREEGINDIIRP